MWHQWWSFYQTLWQKKRLQVIINFPHLEIMNRKIKQCWSSIPLITTKRTIASYLNWTHWTRTETTIYHVTNQGLCLGQAQNVTELNQLMGSQPNHLDNWISNCNAYTMYKQTIKKLAQTRFHSKRCQPLTHVYGVYISQLINQTRVCIQTFYKSQYSEY